MLAEHGGPVKLEMSWAKSFLDRHNYSSRVPTTNGFKLPVNFVEVKATALAQIAHILRDEWIDPMDMINMDETGFLMRGANRRTMAKTGSKQVTGIAVNAKDQLTKVTAITSDGDLLPFALIYQGKTDKVHKNTVSKKSKAQNEITFFTFKKKFSRAILHGLIRIRKYGRQHSEWLQPKPSRRNLNLQIHRKSLIKKCATKFCVLHTRRSIRT